MPRLVACAVALVLAVACGGGGGNPTWDCGPPLPVNLVLGRPTDTSIAISLLAEAGTAATCDLGTAPGAYDRACPPQTSIAGEPIVFELTDLAPATRYYYRVRVQAPGGAEVIDAEHTFHTARAPGATFHFGVQGDSHPERQGKMYSPELYGLNLANVAARQPDFYLALGDDFSIERLLEHGELTQANVDLRYRCQRDALGVAGHSTALYLVNGNHEQAAGYLLTDAYRTPFADAPRFAGLARVTYFPLPAPDGFYAGDATALAPIGPLRDYYAWEWGDALFVTIDPYWHSPVPADTGVPGVGKADDPWAISIGDAQYAWLRATLTASRARYKFVFTHHPLGGGRGAAGMLHRQEWGGYDDDGAAYEFTARRPGWAQPIHQLLVDAGVTIVFFAHDHVFAREIVDGVIYQSTPNPADDTYTAWNADAYDPDAIALPGASYDPAAGVVLPNAGFLDVTVAPAGVRVDYVRAVLPGDEAAAGTRNGEVAFSYTAPAR